MPDNQGRLSPTTTSSGQQVEPPDNSVEYYVKASKAESEYVPPEKNVHISAGEICGNCKFYLAKEDACTVVAGGIERNAYCKLYVKGGEKDMDKGLDVDESITTDRAYEANTNTTEPDPKSELAMQKYNNKSLKQLKKSIKKTRKELRKFAKAAAVGGPTYTKPATQDGVGTYSTTANTTVGAPASGSTTEPESVHKADEPSMQLCNCAGMSKCIGCACAGCQTCDGCEDDQCQGCGCEHGVTKATDDADLEKAGCDCCDKCGPECKGACCDACKITKKGDDDENPAGDDDDNKDFEKEVTKSEWNFAFAPGIPNAALRTVFKIEE